MRSALAIKQQRMGSRRPAHNRVVALPRTVQASVGGWDRISSLANMKPDRAVILDNFIPRPGYLEIRRGYSSWATGVGAGPVESILIYNGISTNKQFATGSNGTLYETSAGGAAVATTIVGLSSTRLQYVNFTGVDGSHYLFAGNGSDPPIKYDGTNWANTAITLSSGSQNSIVQFNAFKGLLFGILKNTTKFVSGSVGQISGAFTITDLGPYITKGGYLVAMATWSTDTKQTIDDYAVFITSRGQCLVFQGIDPTTTVWSMVSNFWIGPPIGQRCFLQIGGDLAVISVDGLLPLSQMISLDRSAAGRTSFTNNIMNAMNDAARNYGSNFGWQLMSYPRGQLAIMNIPVTENSLSYQYVMDTLTGAWCRFTGINANCWETMNEIPYFGGNAGIVYQWDTGSGDGSGPITARVETAFNYFGSRGIQKKFNTIRPILTTDNSVTPGVGINVDYNSGSPVSIPNTISGTGALWDSAVWDTAVWPAEGGTTANVTTISGIGTCASIITTVATSNNGLANGVLLRLNAWDITFEPSPGAGL